MAQCAIMESFRNTFDVASVAVVIGTLAEWLPPAAAAASIVWTLIRISETKTFRKLVYRGRRD